MNNEIIKYTGLSDQQLEVLADGVMDGGLNDTFTDLGQLIAYMRDLSADLRPLATNLNTTIADTYSFINANKEILIGSSVAIGALLLVYLGTGVARNIRELR